MCRTHVFANIFCFQAYAAVWKTFLPTTLAPVIESFPFAYWWQTSRLEDKECNCLRICLEVQAIRGGSGGLVSLTPALLLSQKLFPEAAVILILVSFLQFHTEKQKKEWSTGKGISTGKAQSSLPLYPVQNFGLKYIAVFASWNEVGVDFLECDSCIY